ncbi:MAG: hypothetical protein A2052_06755 [Deltaproteobacteria bacterium GWA2_54_12]|nr:MAG: hypothetical protein A2052_06755 [Deltaproteobacteria bacterium GWA2_54_12]
MEDNAVTEIKNLSENARRHLQHKLRGGLQSVISCIEEGALEDASNRVLDISDELRNMGL